jgi:hypothetical protein
MLSLRNCLQRLGSGPASDPQATHGRIDDCLTGCTEPGGLFAQAPALTEPRTSPCRHPSARQDWAGWTRSGLPLRADADPAGGRPHGGCGPAQRLCAPGQAWPRAVVTSIKPHLRQAGNCACVCARGSPRTPLARAITSAGWTGTVWTKPCVSTRRGRWRPFLRAIIPPRAPALGRLHTVTLPDARTGLDSPAKGHTQVVASPGV